MEWLLWLLLVAISYKLIGAAVLATLDPKDQLYRWAFEHDCVDRVVWLFPLFAWRIFVRRHREKTEKGF